jgi:two-component system sensor histidine kinase KdpD
MQEVVDHRPSPEALLEQARKEDRGKLKIFLGAAPGVGKTYEMLLQGRQRRLEGVDAVIGVVETHGRVETDALTKALETVPKKRVPYKGRVLMEMDLDAIIQRRPRLVLVDELAHTNAEGSRHPKRYLDVEDILAAGIDVYTTVNIQHIESLNDIIAQITRIRVRETVPDRVLDDADEIELVDTTAEDLVQRLKAGKVYGKEQAERALRHYFSPGNLTALRELALRKAAQHVDRDMVEYMQAHAIAGPWPAGEHVLACVNEDPSSTEVVRRAKRFSDDMKASWAALYVEGSRDARLTEVERDRIADTLRLAQRLGAEPVTIPGSRVADAILSYAHKNNVTQIVIGKIERPLWFELLHGSIVHDLIRKSGPIGVQIVAASGETVPPKSVKTVSPTEHSPWRHYGWSLASVVATLCVTQLLDLWVGFGNLGMIFLMPVLFSAASYGLRPALVTSFLSVMTYNFFFIPPRYTFTVATPENVLTLLLFFVVALIASNLAARIRTQAEIAAERARVTSALYAFTGKLVSIAQLYDILWASCSQIASMLKANVVILLPDPQTGRPVIRAGWPPEDELDDQDLAAATWCWDHGKSAGRNSETLPGAKRLFLPMRTGEGPVGVVGLLLPEERPLLTPDERRLLDSLIDQIALAVERSQLVERIEEARVREQADKLRGAMLASLSHDLRTPLASILGAATSLRAYPDMYGPAQRAEMLTTLQEEAERLDRFVGNLLDMSRLEAGVLGVKDEPAYIPEIVESAVKRLARLIKDHRVDRDVPDDLPLANADPLLLEQALVNLLDNAAKYTPAGSVIRIRGSVRGGGVELTVEDDGPGIPAHEIPHIFDKFYRAKAGDQKVAGTGLGLAVAKGFVEAMRGTLDAATKRHGRGAIFTITLPLAAQPSASDVA